MITSVVCSGWDNKFGLAKKGRGWFETVLVENILVVESCLGVYWFVVVLL